MRKAAGNSIFKVKGENGNYIVSLERLKNDTNGVPHWKAEVISADFIAQSFSTVYTFKGHYLNELGEAEWVVSRHEE